MDSAQYFDTHTHLNFAVFEQTLEETIEKAQTAGVGQMMVIATNLENARRAVAIAETHSDLYAAVGIHPHHLFEYFQLHQDLGEISGQLADLLNHPSVVAMGEIGLDRWQYTRTRYQNYQVSSEFFDFQIKSLHLQLELALAADTALIVHNRQAGRPLLTELDTFLRRHPTAATAWRHRAVFHCSEPDPAILQFAREHNWYIGVTGDISYVKSKQAFVRRLPVEMMVLETDSPFLPPRPLSPIKTPDYTRSEICHPANLPLVAKWVAHLTALPVEHIASATRKNAEQLFGISQVN